jgi:hypothetical protein
MTSATGFRDLSGPPNLYLAAVFKANGRTALRTLGMSLVSPFEQLFSDAEIKILTGLYPVQKQVHPLVAVALHPGLPQTPGRVTINTCRALNFVLTQFPQWGRTLKPRLADVKDWTASESALAEIRACGALLEAGYAVKLGSKNPNSGAKPEFQVMEGDDETVVEVWTRNLSKSELAQIKAQQAATFTSTEISGGTLTSSVATVAPFGSPDPSKEGDSILTNVINRVAAIKEREHQADDRRPFVVWVDLQSETTMRFDSSEHLLPLMSWNGIVTSGGYWHALYGRKGDILLDTDRPYNRANGMLHDGRFRQIMKHGGPTRISAFVFSTAETLAIMENPLAPFPLTAAFRSGLIDLPSFDIGVSLADWSDRLVAKTIDHQRQLISGVVMALGLDAPIRASLISRIVRRLSDWLDTWSRRLRDCVT